MNVSLQKCKNSCLVQRKYHSNHKGKSLGIKVSKNICSDLGWCIVISCLATTVPSWAWEVAFTGRGRHLTFSEHFFLGAFAFAIQSEVNSNISTRLVHVSHGFSSCCSRVTVSALLVVYSVSKIRQLKIKRKKPMQKLFSY